MILNAYFGVSSVLCVALIFGHVLFSNCEVLFYFFCYLLSSDCGYLVFWWHTWHVAKPGSGLDVEYIEYVIPSAFL